MLGALQGFFPGGGEAGADIPGHEGGHLDVMGPHLVGQGQHQGVEGGFRGGIKALEGNG